MLRGGSDGPVERSKEGEAWDGVIVSRWRTRVPRFGAWSRQAAVVASGANFDVEVCAVCKVFVSECLMHHNRLHGCTRRHFVPQKCDN